MTRDEHVEISRANARERIASARTLIDRIGSGRLTFHQQVGDEPMRDVTNETLAEQHQKIEQNEELLRMYGADGA